MLSKTPKTAQELGISAKELEALHWVRNALATGLLQTHEHKNRQPGAQLFDMDMSCRKDGGCGTVACIGGWMGLHMGMDEDETCQYVGKIGVFPHSALRPLFWPMQLIAHEIRYNSPEKAVAAIDRWLDGERDIDTLWPKEVM